jgi:hypothetical protein
VEPIAVNTQAAKQKAKATLKYCIGPRVVESEIVDRQESQRFDFSPFCTRRFIIHAEKLRGYLPRSCRYSGHSSEGTSVPRTNLKMMIFTARSLALRRGDLVASLTPDIHQQCFDRRTVLHPNEQTSYA